MSALRPSLLLDQRFFRQAIAGLLSIAFLCVAVSSLVFASDSKSDAAWSALTKPGHVVLMRHSRAPGYGDPPGWRLDDCATQRNLDSGGRDHAKRVRAELATRGITFDQVLSSAWCRCTETARLATGREPEVFAALNSFFEDRSSEARQIAAIQSRLIAMQGDRPVLMVTHQVVVAALVGRSPSSGELIVAKRGKDGTLTAVGSITIK